MSYMKEFDDQIDDALTIASFERKDFKGFSDKVTEVISCYEAKDKKDDERLAQIGQELTKHSEILPKLKE